MIITHTLPSIACAKEQKVWRVIYVEGGSYTDYQQIFAGTIRGLAKLGLIPNGNVPVPKGTESTKGMWDWLVANANGGRIEFLPDGHYSAEWDEKQRAANKKAILARNDVDMIFAFGTWAGRDFATDEHSIPTFSMSVTDAVDAGIVASVEDSGRDHVHAQLEPGRYYRQLATFHDIFKFKRLGVPFEDSPEGRSSIAMPEIERSAQELGFTIVPCTAQFNVPDLDLAADNLLQCLETLSEKTDALYLTVTAGMQGHRMVDLLQPAIKNSLPTFSQSGPNETELGVLMSLAQASFDDVGLFEANAIASVINGAKPRDVNQVFEGPLGLAINLRMAMLIGWDPSFDVLAAVDTIHRQIKNTEQQKD